MSSATLDARAIQLRDQGVPFVRARVVLAEKPTSAKPGDEAIIHSDGSIEGFVGGTCAESTVRAQSLAQLDSKLPLLLRITPTEEAASGDQWSTGTKTVHNPCLSGGTLEIFLDPVVPAPLLQVHGEGPVADALARLATAMEYRVSALDSSALAGAAAVVVASHGREEPDVLAAALDAGVPYIGLLASRRRGAGVLAELVGMRPDLAGVLHDRVHTPAGLDIGARTAAEIALSILAEMVDLRANSVAPPPIRASDPAPATAIDPVCGMRVAAVEASLHLDHNGRRFYFCGSGCLKAFSADPAGYPAL
jgi:xanthine dehydrogenase accessory factor